MSQLYVPDGTWTLCSEGKKISKLQVSSQTTIRIAGGKLKATEEDRFEGNFVCFKMITAGAALGAAVGAVMAASGGVLLGGMLASIASGASIGAIAGTLAGKIPSICSFLCKCSDWTEVHPKVYIAGKKALLQKATLSCFLGGTVSLKMPELQEAIDMGLLAGEDVYADSWANNKNMTPAQQERLEQYNRLSNEEISNLGLKPEMFHIKNDDGFYAQLYKKGNTYVLAYRGTQELPDVVEDGVQGVGISSGQYDKAVDLANAIKDNPNFNEENTIISGHSLGGGLAAIAGGATGYPTYTYNAAGVHDATLKRNRVHREDMNHVQAYNASDDPLNMAQDNREAILGRLGWLGGLTYLTGALPRAAGQRMQVDTEVGIFNGHTAIHLVNELEKELQAMGGGNSSVWAQNK